MTSKCDTVEDKWLRSLLMSTSLTAFAPEDTWAYPQHFRMRSKQLFPMDGSLPVSFLGSSSTDWYKDNWLCHRTAFFVQKAKWSGFCNGECVGCSAVCPAVCNCACAVCFGGEEGGDTWCGAEPLPQVDWDDPCQGAFLASNGCTKYLILPLYFREHLLQKKVFFRTLPKLPFPLMSLFSSSFCSSSSSSACVCG